MTFANGSTRLLMVNKFHYPRGGAEHYMFRLAALLAKRGMEAVYFACRHPDNEPCATAEYFASEADFGEPAGGLGRLRLATRTLYSMEARRQMSRLLAAERVDVAHLHNIYHHLSPSILAPLRSHGIPVVMTVHDFKLVCPVYSLMSHGEICERCVEGSFANAVRYRCNRGSLAGSALVAGETWAHSRLGLYTRGVDVFITPSKFARDKLVARGYPAGRVRVIPNFVDVEEHQPTFAAGSYFVYVGRLSREKGVDVLLEALAGTGLKVKLAGEGPARAELEQLARRLDVDAEFLGYLGPDGLASAARFSRAVVLPSRCHENCPLAVLEAMAWGKPVVASRVGGVPELVASGHNGLLVPPADAGRLREALRHLAADPSAAEDMGRAGRALAEAKYAPAAHLEAVLEAYRLAATLRSGTRAA
jgi:glycosyltransferase involved in cell wall biosynthesis